MPDRLTRVRLQYSGKDIVDFEGIIDRNVLAFAHLIDTRYAMSLPSGGSTSTAAANGNSYDNWCGQPFDFARKAQYFALDVTTELSFGEPFGDMATDSDVHGYIETTERTLPHIILTTELPWLVSVFELDIVKRFLPSDKDLLGIGRAMGCVLSILLHRFGPSH